jgi:hypothetical protein
MPASSATAISRVRNTFLVLISVKFWITGLSFLCFSPFKRSLVPLQHRLYDVFEASTNPCIPSVFRSDDQAEQQRPRIGANRERSPESGTAHLG